MINDDDLLPLVLDYFRSGAAQQDMEVLREMDKQLLSDIQELRHDAERLYGKAGESTPEEAISHQCVILTVIAEQLARIASALEGLEAMEAAKGDS